MERASSFSHFSDGGLTIELARLIHAERGATADVVACIAEFDLRRLYLPQGFSSMFVYCRDHLHLGEGAAYRRIEAARSSRRFPEIPGMLASGAITLTNLVLIAHHLTEANRKDLLAEITHKTKAEVEVIVARLKPKADVPTVIRKLPMPVATAAPVAPVSPKPAELRPDPQQRPIHRPIVALSPERYRLQIMLSQRAHDNLRQLQDLMRHSLPNGDAAQVVERALETLLKEVLRRKCGIVNRPRRGDALERLTATAR
jgi:hypothetical protein